MAVAGIVSYLGPTPYAASAQMLRLIQQIVGPAAVGGPDAARAARPRATSAPTPKTAETPRDTFRSDFSALAGAVRSGDMAAAQDALKTLETDRKAFYGAGGSKPARAGISQDLQAFAGAVQSGDMARAQQALQTLQGDMQALRGHGHPAHATEADAASAAPAPQTAPTTIDLANAGNKS